MSMNGTSGSGDAASRSQPGTGTGSREPRFTQTCTSSPRATTSSPRVKVCRARNEVRPIPPTSVRQRDQVVEQDPAEETAAAVHDRDPRPLLEDPRERVPDLGQPLGEAAVHPAVHRGEVDLGGVHLGHGHAEGLACGRGAASGGQPSGMTSEIVAANSGLRSGGRRPDGGERPGAAPSQSTCLPRWIVVRPDRQLLRGLRVAWTADERPLAPSAHRRTSAATRRALPWERRPA